MRWSFRLCKDSPRRDKKRITAATEGDAGGYSRMEQDAPAIKRPTTQWLSNSLEMIANTARIHRARPTNATISVPATTDRVKYINDDVLFPFWKTALISTSQMYYTLQFGLKIIKNIINILLSLPRCY